MEKEPRDIKYQIEHNYKLQTLMHKVNRETLLIQHEKQKKGKATGIDNVTKQEFDVNAMQNIDDIIVKMKKMAYRPLPVKRAYIPKANGTLRPLGIPAYGDKLVQGAMADILNDIYENIFLDCSFGFRPNRNCHDVVKYINNIVMTKKINYILEADIKGFFDNVNHDWLMKFLEYNIADRKFLRYIKRFLISGVMEDMKYMETNKGTPQGGLISPVLANVYLHFVLDLWFEKAIKAKMNGEAYLVRYADDFLIMFQYERDAKLFMQLVIERFKKFGLELEMTKTRTIPFGRYKGTKDKFDFLGFTFVNGRTRNGRYRVVIKTSQKKLKQKRQNIKKWLKENMHKNIMETLEKLKPRLIGHYNYYGVNGNSSSLQKFYNYVRISYFRTLQKRGQKHPITLERFQLCWEVAQMPKPKICVDIWH